MTFLGIVDGKASGKGSVKVYQIRECIVDGKGIRKGISKGVADGESICNWQHA